MSTLNTPDWTFKLSAKYVPSRTPKIEKCTSCGGKGTYGLHFGCIDDEPQTCSTCYGTGNGRVIDPLAPEPELSPALIAHLRKALSDILANLPECFGAGEEKQLF